jgi:hypothetical protein
VTDAPAWLAVGLMVAPNKLMRLAGYTRRDLAGAIEAVGEVDDEGHCYVTVAGRAWSSDWLEPWSEADDERDRRAEMLEHGRGRLGRGRRGR